MTIVAHFNTNFSLWVDEKMNRNQQKIGPFKFLSNFLIITSLRCDLTLAQRCSVTCTQTAVVRNMTYDEAYEIVQNRAWENEDDFGDELLDLIRRHKRVKHTLFRNKRFLLNLKYSKNNNSKLAIFLGYGSKHTLTM